MSRAWLKSIDGVNYLLKAARKCLPLLTQIVPLKVVLNMVNFAHISTKTLVLVRRAHADLLTPRFPPRNSLPYGNA